MLKGIDGIRVIGHVIDVSIAHPDFYEGKTTPLFQVDAKVLGSHTVATTLGSSVYEVDSGTQNGELDIQHH